MILGDLQHHFNYIRIEKSLARTSVYLILRSVSLILQHLWQNACLSRPSQRLRPNLVLERPAV